MLNVGLFLLTQTVLLSSYFVDLSGSSCAEVRRAFENQNIGARRYVPFQPKKGMFLPLFIFIISAYRFISCIKNAQKHDISE